LTWFATILHSGTQASHFHSAEQPVERLLQRAQLRHALAVHCGEPATTFSFTPDSSVATSLPSIPISVPSEWLEHRPDVAAAEHYLDVIAAQTSALVHEQTVIQLTGLRLASTVSLTKALGVGWNPGQLFVYPAH
jgi:outer membrane protein TolC